MLFTAAPATAIEWPYSPKHSVAKHSVEPQCLVLLRVALDTRQLPVCHSSSDLHQANLTSGYPAPSTVIRSRTLYNKACFANFLCINSIMDRFDRTSLCRLFHKGSSRHCFGGSLTTLERAASLVRTTRCVLDNRNSILPSALRSFLGTRSLRAHWPAR
jgi:hypothetical protein